VKSAMTLHPSVRRPATYAKVRAVVAQQNDSCPVTQRVRRRNVSRFSLSGENDTLPLTIRRKCEREE
jgi:hypothetical protein